MSGTPQRLYSVGTRVKLIREEKGMSPAELAQRAGMKKQSIYKYERDITKTLPYDTIKRLADALDVNPSYLVGWSSSKEITPDIITRPQEAVVSDFVDFI